jgi:Zinc-binding dehydrogenase
MRLEEVAEAHRYMESNRATGKLVVLVGGDEVVESLSLNLPPFMRG